MTSVSELTKGLNDKNTVAWTIVDLGCRVRSLGWVLGEFVQFFNLLQQVRPEPQRQDYRDHAFADGNGTDLGQRWQVDPGGRTSHVQALCSFLFKP